MKKSGLFALNIIFCGAMLYAFSLLYSHRTQIKLLELWKNHLVDLASNETSLVGLRLEDYKLIGEKSLETTFFSQINPEKYTIIFLTSVEKCSACREEAERLMNSIISNKKGPEVLAIFSESEIVPKERFRMTFGLAMSSTIRAPKFFDTESIILNSLGLQPEQTPVILVVDNSGMIVNANLVTKETLHRSEQFATNIFKVNDL